ARCGRGARGWGRGGRLPVPSPPGPEGRLTAEGGPPGGLMPAPVPGAALPAGIGVITVPGATPVAPKPAAGVPGVAPLIGIVVAPLEVLTGAPVIRVPPARWRARMATVCPRP